LKTIATRGAVPARSAASSVGAAIEASAPRISLRRSGVIRPLWWLQPKDVSAAKQDDRAVAQACPNVVTNERQRSRFMKIPLQAWSECGEQEGLPPFHKGTSRWWGQAP
jgi:hypothetical protein